MDFWVVTPVFLLVLFAGMLLFLEIGRRVGMRRMTGPDGPDSTGFGAVEGAVFGLLGLLIAFTFSGAGSRFDARRQLVAEEANAIGTAYLRIELLPAEKQPAMRDLFRQYLDTRLAAYQKLPDMDSAKTELARAEALQKVIWTNAVAASRESNTTAASMLLLPALNHMIDITTTRNVARRTHPPTIIFAMLGGFWRWRVRCWRDMAWRARKHVVGFICSVLRPYSPSRSMSPLTWNIRVWDSSG